MQIAGKQRHFLNTLPWIDFKTFPQAGDRPEALCSFPEQLL